MKAEIVARTITILLVVGLLGTVITARLFSDTRSELISGRMAETGGWTPDAIRAEVGKPLLLRVTSEDVVHGFAVGQLDHPEVEIEPGKVAEITLDFEQPGEYTFYCTRWCGINHWRMRGIIQVEGGEEPASKPSVQPDYVRLGLDIDAPHQAQIVPDVLPGSGKEPADVTLQAGYLEADYFRSHAPEQVFSDLRSDSDYAVLSDDEIWHLVSQIWAANTTQEGLDQGQQLYRQNCAACHGEGGQGDGVFASEVTAQFGGSMPGMEHSAGGPVDFTKLENMLGASPALLQGKILRGGMGTGMPYWGPIFTDQQIWDLVAYLFTFSIEIR